MQENIDKTAEGGMAEQESAGESKGFDSEEDERQEATSTEETTGLQQPRSVRPPQRRDPSEQERQRRQRQRPRQQQGGAYQGAVEQVITMPVQQLLRLQDDFANFVLYEMEQSTREQSRNTNITQDFLDNFAETFATATILPTEILQRSLNPFRSASADQQHLQATQDASEQTPEESRSQMVQPPGQGPQVYEQPAAEPQQPAMGTEDSGDGQPSGDQQSGLTAGERVAQQERGDSQSGSRETEGSEHADPPSERGGMETQGASSELAMGPEQSAEEDEQMHGEPAELEFEEEFDGRESEGEE